MPAFVSLIAGSIGTVLLSIIGHVVGRVLLSLGYGFVQFYGMSELIGWVQSEVVSQLVGLPANMLGMIGMLRLVDILNMYLAAYVASFLPSLLADGSFMRIIQRGSV